MTMAIFDTYAPPAQTPLRLWPAVVIIIAQWSARFGLPVMAPGAEVFSVPLDLVAVLAGTLGGIAIIVWWLFFSRARWSDRLSAVVVMVAAILVTQPLMHMSIQGGMMGAMFVIYLLPLTLSLALVIWAVAARGLSTGLRLAALVVVMLAACGGWWVVRTEGLQGGVADLEWRWTPTAEELLLARAADEPKPILVAAVSEAPSEPPAAARVDLPPASSVAPAAGKADPVAPAASEVAAGPTISEGGGPRIEWPGFRGPLRDGVIHGVTIKTDWSASPPVEMWRRPIGPGWSSFAVSGDLLYTQEQRGEDEIVACYRVSTGEPVWRHRDPVRFWESNGGAGPRATPTLHQGRVYAFGATGILNALDARTGKAVWSHNVSTDAERAVPDWGFSSSPLVVDDVVIVAAAGTLVGYDLADGRLRWTGPKYDGGYSSPHRVTIDGVEQVVLLGGPGATSVDPSTGTVLWKQEWTSSAIVQPALLADGDILISALVATGGAGTRRLHVTQGAGGWRVDERWTSNGLKPYFNDYVVHNGHAFGFDGSILASINLEDGKRAWKGGRYGNGQLVLLPDQDLLLVLSEDGELALVSATTEQFREVARFPALHAKTWNHPVLVGDVLLVRNGEEMAAFRLSLVESAAVTR